MKFQIGVLIVLCYVEFIKGSCLSYGHSCWGAHGKRASPPRAIEQQQQQKQIEQLNDRWALVKIISDKNDANPLNKIFKNHLRSNQIMDAPIVEDDLVKVPQNQPPQLYSNPLNSDEDFIPPDDLRKLNTHNELSVKDEMDSNEIPKFYDDSGNAKQYKFFKINQRFPKYIH